MFSRSIVGSFRQATARPAVMARPAAARVLAVRGYSDAAEASKEEKKAEEGQSDEAKKIAELEEKLKESTKEMQYLRADYQTVVRRGQEEKAKAADFAIAKFARALLSTSDVLSQALKHVPQPVDKGTPLADLVTGVELTQKALNQTFNLHGIKPMGDLVGEQFDPNNHEAIFQVPAAVAPKRADGSDRAPGEIIEVQKLGWLIKDRTLRPAEVGVVQME